MTVLIGHGYVGTAIAKALTEADIPYRHASHNDWYADTIHGELIINAAGYLGYPNIDACEVNRRETIEGNILFPLSIPGPVIHITTGCIYEGDNGGKGWSETDPPNFEKSFYSLTKLLAEEQLRYKPDTWILRIRQPFGAQEHKRNLLTKFKNYAKLFDVTNSISDIDDVADVVVHFINQRPTPGLYNVTNPGSISVKEIADMLGIEKEWFTPDEFKVSCPAPRSNCVLNTNKITSIFPLRPVHQAIEEAIREYHT